MMTVGGRLVVTGRAGELGEVRFVLMTIGTESPSPQVTSGIDPEVEPVVIEVGAVPRVRGDLLLPDRARDDAEHRAAVEAEKAVVVESEVVRAEGQHRGSLFYQIGASHMNMIIIAAHKIGVFT